MAFSNSASDRMDELRFRSQQSARNDSPLLGLVSPPRNGARLPPPTHSNDGRTSLTRRFTTDSSRVPTLSSLASQRGQDSQEFGPSVRWSSPPKEIHLSTIPSILLMIANAPFHNACEYLLYLY
jgi:hypothetical protein